MRIGDYTVYFHNPFKKKGLSRILGINAYKDWYHSYEWAAKFSLFKYPHLTIDLSYTTKDEFIMKFWNFRSKSYRNYSGSLTAYEYRCYKQGIEEGRDGCG